MLPLMPDIFSTVSFVTWLDRDRALTYIPMDTVRDMGAGGRPEGSRTWAPFLQHSGRMDTTVGQVTSPKGSGVLIGWLYALGRRAWTFSIYREASMPTLARSGKGLGGENKRGRGKSFGKTIVPCEEVAGWKLSFFRFLFYVCFSDQWQ